MNSRGQGAGDREQGAEPDRREFLSMMGSAAISLGALGGAARPAAAKLDRIGIQLYTVRGEFARDVEGTLARIAEIGFKEVEFAGYPQGTAPSLKSMLDRLGLAAPSSHVSIRALRSDWDRTLEEAARLGQRFIVVPSLPQADRRTPDDWKRTAALFSKAGEISQKAGIQFCYHNHDFEFAALDGIVPYDLLLAEADRSLVQMELDLYWVTKGGRDPLEYFAKYPGRFPLVHVKDMDATPRKSFADVGTGTIDFRRIFTKAKQAGIRHYFYEQDTTPGAPLTSAKVSFEYLKHLTY